MNYKDLFYFPNYNRNFIESFKVYLSTNFKNVSFNKFDDHYLITLQASIDKLFADMVLVNDIDTMTIDTMSTICIDHFEELHMIRDVYEKVSIESDFNPKIINAKILFQYNVLERTPIFMAEFTLKLYQ